MSPATSVPRRIAMWSGPRNISTALMRSWGSRPDTFVCDEPFYAHYLFVTRNKHHPGYEETLATHSVDWRKVVAWLTGPIPERRSIFYQKQMAHHLLPQIEREWIDQLSNCFLIRDPYEMLTSLAELLPNPRPEDTGLPQQVELFRQTWERTGQVPPVIDAHDVLADPAALLSRLCQQLELPFDKAMLHWEPGLRPTDGAWAPYWYAKVAQTTGFSPNRPPKAKLPEELLPVLEVCRPLYEELHAHRLAPLPAPLPGFSQHAANL